jgi:hypothetical protein
MNKLVEGKGTSLLVLKNWKNGCQG